MIKCIILIGLLLINVLSAAKVPIYRYWNAGNGGDHFYTQNLNEIGTSIPGVVGNHGYKSEGIEFQLPDSNKGNGPKTIALLRYWNPHNTDHFYTTNINELGPNGNHGWTREGDLGRCFTEETARPNLVPLYRYWNAGNGDHFYTTDINELGASGAHGWNPEGITCYVFPAPEPKDNKGKVDVYRYWNTANGGDHFYTTDAAEIGTITPGQIGNHQYKSEGIGFRLPNPNKANGPKTAVLLRYWNPHNTDHFYTTNINELGENGAHGWTREGDLGRCFTEQSARPNLVPLYRYWNAGNGDHFYTTNYAELGAGAHGWAGEGITCYVYAPKAAELIPFDFNTPNIDDFNNNNYKWGIIQDSTVMYMAYIIVALLIINLIMMTYFNCCKSSKTRISYKTVSIDSESDV